MAYLHLTESKLEFYVNNTHSGSSITTSNVTFEKIAIWAGKIVELVVHSLTLDHIWTVRDRSSIKLRLRSSVHPSRQWCCACEMLMLS